MAKARKRKAKARKKKATTRKRKAATGLSSRRTKRAGTTSARKSARKSTGKSAKRRTGSARRKAAARKTGGRAVSARNTKRKAKRAPRKTRRATPTRAEELRRADVPNPDNPAEAAGDLHTPDPVHSEDGGVAQHPVHDSDTEDLRSADYERMIDERAKGGFDTSDKYEIEREAGRKMRKPGEV